MNASQFFPAELKLLYTIGGLVIASRPAPEVTPGHQHIYILEARDHNPGALNLLAHDLAVVLGAASYTHIELAGERWLVIPHTQQVDTRLKQLVDLAHAVRMAAPGLVQLALTVEAATV